MQSRSLSRARPPRAAELASPRLRRLTAAHAPGGGPAPAEEMCELCSAPVAPEHRHVLDLRSRQLMCSCRACALLFDNPAAGAGHFRLVPERRVRLAGPAISDLGWESLMIPVDMAFFVRHSAAGRVMAFYPSPMGATESHLELSAWEEIEHEHPLLRTLASDVEALLVNRARGARCEWLVPIDDCFRLVAVVRTRWRGFTGGREVWQEIERFFAELDRRAVDEQRPASTTTAERR